MTVLDILKYPDERLKQQSEPIASFDSELAALIADLEDTIAVGPGAVGLAAPQAGVFKRVAIVDVSSKKGIETHGHLVLVNPEITAWDGFAIGREGCLSVPDYTGNVIRAEKITLQAFDQKGESLSFVMHGYEARAVQHELDHLDGLLFLDRLVSRRSDLFVRKNYKKKVKKID